MSVQWSDALITGIEDIDNQHRELFRQINKLHDACREGKGKETIDSLMAFLSDYIVDHFKTEERFMAQYDYPDMKPHKTAHEEFIKRFGELRDEFYMKGERLVSVIMSTSLLGDWWLNHIMKIDKALASYLRSKK